MRVSALVSWEKQLPQIPVRLLDGLSAALALRESARKVRRAHVRRVNRLLEAGLPDDCLTLLGELVEAFGSGRRPLRWTPAARRLRGALEPREPNWFSQGLSDDACAWAAPDLLSIHDLQAGSEHLLAESIAHVCSAAQGVALADGIGVVLPSHVAKLRDLVDAKPRASDGELIKFMGEGARDMREHQPGVRFHPNCLEAIRLLVYRVHDRDVRFPVPPKLEDERAMAGRPVAYRRAVMARTLWSPTPRLTPLSPARAPALEGLLIGWKGRRVASATSRQASEPVLHKGEGHLITIAPTGAGKGVGAVIPALLSHRGSAIVVDPKGENFAVTARFRRELGQQVHVLDPFSVTGELTDRLNLFDLLANPSDPTWEEAVMATELLVPRNMNISRNRWWYDRGHELLAALYLLASTHPMRREGGLGSWLSHFELTLSELRARGRDLRRSMNPDLRIAARSLLSGSDDSFRSSVMMAQGLVAELSNPAVGRCANGPSSISLADLAAGVPMTIYLVLPPDQLRAQAPLMRLWLGMLLHAVLERRVAPKERTLFLVDEAAQLGQLTSLVTAITLARGYGVSVWTFWQDLAQLRAAYPGLWKTILHNCSVHQVFGVPNEATAMELARLHGMDDHRRLLSAEHDSVLLTQSGRMPIEVRRANYLRDAAFAGSYDPNPLHRRDEYVRQPGSKVSSIQLRS